MLLVVKHYATINKIVGMVKPMQKVNSDYFYYSIYRGNPSSGLTNHFKY